MKAIMISDKPKWCALMMNGDKTVEVRTSKALANAIQKLIDEYGFADIYVYCSKDKKNYLYWDWYDPPYITEEWFVSSNPKIWSDDRKNINGPFNGKIKFKFRCYKVEEIKREYTYNEYACVVSREWLETNTCSQEELSKKTCLIKDELFKYLGNKTGYAIHISDLEIFDKPKELWKFTYIKRECRFNGLRNERYDVVYILEKAPQNFCYVEVENE